MKDLEVRRKENYKDCSNYQETREKLKRMNDIVDAGYMALAGVCTLIICYAAFILK